MAIPRVEKNHQFIVTQTSGMVFHVHCIYDSDDDHDDHDNDTSRNLLSKKPQVAALPARIAKNLRAQKGKTFPCRPKKCNKFSALS